MTCPACGATNSDDASACVACGEALSRRGTIKPGFLLAGRYEILTTLGQGGMGVVYKAHDRTLNEIVAIKVLRPDAAASPEMARRFLTEIRLARTVTHRNVCRIHEYGEDQGLHYISMSFVDGVDLKHLLRERGALPPDEAYDVMLQVAEGLQAIHDEGIIHRDLKTPTLMMDERGVVRLMDFGIAKQREADDAAPVTGLGMIIGTPEYMSPEQVRGEKLDTRSDIYALGIVMYELLTGETPFRAETPVAMLMRHLQEAPSFDSDAAARIPAAIVPVLRQALAKDREERFQSASELAAALRLARGEPQPLVPRAVPPRTRSATAQRLDPRSVPTPTSIPVPTEVSSSTAPNATLTEHSGRRLDAPAASMRGQARTRRSPVLAYGLLGGGAVLGLGLLLFVWLGRTPEGASTGVAAYPAAMPSSILPTAGRGGQAPTAGLGGQAPIAGRGGQAVPPSSPIAGPGGQTGPASYPSTQAEQPRTASPLPAGPSPEPRPSDLASPQAKASAGPSPRPPSVEPGGRASAPSDRPVAPKTAALAAQVDGLLAEAESAFATRQFPMAVGFYDEALKLDATNTRARVGRDVASKALAQPPARAFVTGKTSTAAAAPEASSPHGFEDGGGALRKVVQQGSAPGKIAFAIEPEGVKPGDAYSVKVYFVNEGERVARFKDVSVVTTVNGSRASGPVRPLVAEAAPHERALIMTASDHWKTETTSWSMAVTVRTDSGDTYQNEVRWQ
jgi:serine/threonine protein kinase